MSILTLLILYCVLSVVLTIFLSAFTEFDVKLRDLQPSLGRRLVLVWITPGVFIMGLVTFLGLCFFGEEELSNLPAALKGFFVDLKEIWDGR